MRAHSEERSLLEVQHRLRAGIFDCDDQIVFSDARVRIGSFESTVIGSLSSAHGGQMTSSWVNTESFMHAWEHLRTHGSRFARFDWTIKVDPDTVLLPAVLRRQLRAFVRPGAIFLNNCPGVDDGFYGSVEAMSQAAAIAYVENIRRCRETLDYRSGWGEDLFAQRCMEQAGVQQVNDFELVLDGNCRGPRVPDCSPGYPAYHPKKAAAEWKQCWSQATHRGRPSAWEYQEEGFGDTFDSGNYGTYEDMDGGRFGHRKNYGRNDDFDFEDERRGDRFADRDPRMTDDAEVEPP